MTTGRHEAHANTAHDPQGEELEHGDVGSMAADCTISYIHQPGELSPYLPENPVSADRDRNVLDRIFALAAQF